MSEPNDASSGQLRQITDPADWDARVIAGQGHPLQLWGWGAAKATSPDWRAHHLASPDGLAQVLIRRLPKPFTAFAYIPRGPIVTGDGKKLLQELKNWAKTQNCLELKIEPASEIPADQLPSGFRPSKQRILLRRTATIDLRPELSDITATYSKKTRQYINKAGRDGVVIRPATRDDLPQIHAIYQTTARRANFALHSPAYYEAVFDQLQPYTQLFVASAEQEMVAFLWNITTSTAFELYGGVTERGQQLHANYLLKQTAILDAKSRGATLYDMNGLLNDGISNFKLGFGQETFFPPTLDAPLSPLYHPYESLLPLGKKLLKRPKQQ